MLSCPSSPPSPEQGVSPDTSLQRPRKGPREWRAEAYVLPDSGPAFSVCCPGCCGGYAVVGEPAEQLLRPPAVPEPSGHACDEVDMVPSEDGAVRRVRAV